MIALILFFIYKNIRFFRLHIKKKRRNKINHKLLSPASLSQSMKAYDAYKKIIVFIKIFQETEYTGHSTFDFE